MERDGLLVAISRNRTRDAGAFARAAIITGVCAPGVGSRVPDQGRADEQHAGGEADAELAEAGVPGTTAPAPPVAVIVTLVALAGTTQVNSPAVVNGEAQPGMARVGAAPFDRLRMSGRMRVRATRALTPIRLRRKRERRDLSTFPFPRGEGERPAWERRRLAGPSAGEGERPFWGRRHPCRPSRLVPSEPDRATSAALSNDSNVGHTRPPAAMMKRIDIVSSNASGRALRRRGLCGSWWRAEILQSVIES